MNTDSAHQFYKIAFSHGRTIKVGEESFKISISRAGILSLPTGQIVANDPLVKMPKKPFIQEVLPGRYPVDLCLARREGSNEERIAFSRILFTNRLPFVWVASFTNDQDSPGKERVDSNLMQSESGIGSFMDKATCDLYQPESMELVDSILEMLTSNFKPTRNWANYPVDDLHNIIMFSTGTGPGKYPSYFAIDAEGDVALLLTSFLVIK